MAAAVTAAMSILLTFTGIATAAACQPAGSRPRLVLDDAGAPLALHRACSLAEERCSRCHTLERVAHAEVATPAQWQEQVERMRRMAGSAISPRDGAAITDCLVYRSFGPAGLDSLRAAQVAGEKGFP